jgi:hypothetical protein
MNKKKADKIIGKYLNGVDDWKEVLGVSSKNNYRKKL